MTKASNTGISIAVLAVCVAASILVFYSSFSRDFVSDDYCVMKFLFQDEGYLVGGFFRPVGDLTLKWTYAIAGWNPWVFYLINAVLHGVNAWLVFVFARKISDVAHRLWMPVAAAAVFLLYHSVGEAVLWAIGRGISLATTLALLALIAFASEMKPLFRYLLVCILYFVALSSYESVLLLPLVLLALAKAEQLKRPIIPWTVALGLTALLNVAARVVITGKVWAPYRGEVFSRHISEYASTFIKAGLRVFMPAMDDPRVFAIGAASIILLVAIFVYRLIKQRRFQQGFLITVLTGLFGSLAMATFYGASTRTPEGDRLLYFPAVFYSLIVSGLIVSVTIRARWAVLVSVCFIQLYFLKRTERNWKTANELSSRVISQVKEQPGKPIYIIDLPSDIEGAYMFRNCFNENLQTHGIDPEGIRVVNSIHVSRAGLLAPARRVRDSLYLQSGTRLLITDNQISGVDKAGRKIFISQAKVKDHTLFWTPAGLAPLSEYQSN